MHWMLFLSNGTSLNSRAAPNEITRYGSPAPSILSRSQRNAEGPRRGSDALGGLGAPSFQLRAKALPGAAPDLLESRGELFA